METRGRLCGWDVENSPRGEFCVSGSEFSQSAIRFITLFNSVCPGLPGN